MPTTPPSEPARNAGESKNPALWNAAAFAYAGVPTSDLFGLTSIVSSSGIVSASTAYGPAGAYSGSSVAVLNTDPMANAEAATLLVVIRPSALDGNNALLESYDIFGGTNDHWALWPDNNAGSGGSTNAISFDSSAGGSYAGRDNRMESATNSIGVGQTSVALIRTSTTTAPQIWVDGVDRTNYRAFPNGKILFSRGPLRIGSGGLGGYKGLCALASGWRRRFTDAEMAQVSADPYAAWRMAATEYEGTTIESGQGAAVMIANAAVFGAWNGPASASDSATGVASVASGVAESVAAGDSDGELADAIAAMQANASGDDQIDALAGLSAAILSGVQARESWASHVDALAATIEQGIAADVTTTDAQRVINAALVAGTSAASQFVASVQALASAQESASAGDSQTTAGNRDASIAESVAAQSALIGAVQVLSAIAETAQAGHSATAAGSLYARLLDTINASDIHTASTATRATLQEIAQATAWFMAEDGGRGYLTGAITLVSVLSGNITTRSELDGRINIKPH